MYNLRLIGVLLLFCFLSLPYWGDAKRPISNTLQQNLNNNPKPISQLFLNSNAQKLNTSDSSSDKQLKPTLKSLYMKLFPVLPQELAKFLSLSFMMFGIIYLFAVTRDTKDALIVTNCGAEAIAFLKVILSL